MCLTSLRDVLLSKYMGFSNCSNNNFLLRITLTFIFKFSVGQIIKLGNVLNFMTEIKNKFRTRQYSSHCKKPSWSNWFDTPLYSFSEHTCNLFTLCQQNTYKYTIYTYRYTYIYNCIMHLHTQWLILFIYYFNLLYT